jgi:peptidoglycan hydrolase-like protein with peptidoglycan-binding domain
MILKIGSKGSLVRLLQTELVALGYYDGIIDSHFGKITFRAVFGFQGDVEHLEADGVVGPFTRCALDQSMMVVDAPLGTPSPSSVGTTDDLICSDETWVAFVNNFIPTITGLPVKYGPGRGVCDGETFTITNGPRGLNDHKWQSIHGKTYPSFHCSSFTNFFLGWVNRYNKKYTGAGNIPSLFSLCESSSALHANNGCKKYRGYKDHCYSIETNGTSKKRLGFKRAMDITEIIKRKKSLPTFVIFAQSTKSICSAKRLSRNSIFSKNAATALYYKWNWWHHTGLFVIDHRQKNSPIYRIAADGYRTKSGKYSGTKIKYQLVNKTWLLKNQNKDAYKIYGVTPGEVGKLLSIGVE